MIWLFLIVGRARKVPHDEEMLMGRLDLHRIDFEGDGFLAQRRGCEALYAAGCRDVFLRTSMDGGDRSACAKTRGGGD